MAITKQQGIALINQGQSGSNLQRTSQSQNPQDLMNSVADFYQKKMDPTSPTGTPSAGSPDEAGSCPHCGQDLPTQNPNSPGASSGQGS